jgi:moderate conductance mechanosensitive channel
MNWGELFSTQSLSGLAVPAGIGIAIIVVLYFLRRYLYGWVHKLTARTKTIFDDIMVRETRVATLLWCIWIGIWAAYKIADTPPAWIGLEEKVIPAMYAAFGIYTLIVIIMAVFKWYRDEICPRTSSNFDEIIMAVLIIGTPIVGGVLGTIWILNILGIKNDAVNAALKEYLPSMAAITIVTVILLLLTVLVVPKVIYGIVRNTRAEQSEEELHKRATTLISVIGTTIQAVIIFIYFLMIARNLGMDVTSILAGTTVVGVALGFGAQSLVKDMISGLFIIMENQYRKGDVIKIAGETGVVEEINLRRTILRDGDGGYHVVPNGEIRVATNYTKQMSRVNLVISVAYETDLDKAIAIINQIGQEMANDPAWQSAITSPPKAVRVDKLGESGIDIRIMGDTKPSKQWDITGELRLRLKKAFDKEGIDIPYTHTKVIFGNMPPQLMTPKEVDIKVGEKEQTPKLPN